jgi:hypothetical protein
MTPIAEWSPLPENRIDLSILRDFSDRNLKDLSRRMLRAVNELSGAVSATTQLVAAPELPQDEAEHLGLVGPTALACSVDPQNLREGQGG